VRKVMEEERMESFTQRDSKEVKEGIETLVMLR
jgi:hypothetical protein